MRRRSLLPISLTRLRRAPDPRNKHRSRTRFEPQAAERAVRVVAPTIDRTGCDESTGVLEAAADHDGIGSLLVRPVAEHPFFVLAPTPDGARCTERAGVAAAGAQCRRIFETVQAYGGREVLLGREVDPPTHDSGA